MTDRNYHRMLYLESMLSYFVCCVAEVAVIACLVVWLLGVQIESLTHDQQVFLALQLILLALIDHLTLVRERRADRMFRRYLDSLKE